MQNSKVEIYNIHPHIVYDWFYDSAVRQGGDGSSFLFCSNPIETATDFIKYWQNKYERNFPHPREEYIGINGEKVVNFHDNNENFIFMDKINPPIYQDYTDIFFIVKEDCYTANLINSDFIIKAII